MHMNNHMHSTTIKERREQRRKKEESHDIKQTIIHNNLEKY